HLGHVDVAVAVAGDAVDGVELAIAVTLYGRADARQAGTVRGVDADAVAQRVRVVVTAELADVVVAVRTAAEAVRLVDVVPDRLDVALAVEHLHSVVLAVGH